MQLLILSKAPCLAPNTICAQITIYGSAPLLTLPSLSACYQLMPPSNKSPVPSKHMSMDLTDDSEFLPSTLESYFQ